MIAGVHGRTGDWSIFRREDVSSGQTVGRKHGPVPFLRRKGDSPEWHCRVVVMRFAQKMSYRLPGILVKSGTRKVAWAFLPSQAIL
jgi:hypothetical protein